MRRAALPLLAALVAVPVAGQDNGLPPPLSEVGFDQRLGASLPLAATFVDEAGTRRPLGDFFGERPVLLALAYYDCPMLCDLVLAGIARSLRAVDLVPGRDFEVVVASFDPTDTPEQAAARRRQALDRYGRPETAGAWHFLTGDQAAIRELTASVGFRYAAVEGTQEYAHAAGLVLATPDGRAARYMYGLEFPPRDLRLALVEAGEGEIGSLIDQALLFCYHYDPTTGRYSFAAMSAVRIGGLLTVVGLAAFMLRHLRRERRSLPAEGA